jgi:hypothetical protein
MSEADGHDNIEVHARLGHITFGERSALRLGFLARVLLGRTARRWNRDRR